MLNATNWKELKKQLRQIQGKAIFKLERVDSMNDGTFYRVLHQVKSVITVQNVAHLSEHTFHDQP